MPEHVVPALEAVIAVEAAMGANVGRNALSGKRIARKRGEWERYAGLAGYVPASESLFLAVVNDDDGKGLEKAEGGQEDQV